ncbi:hypothetical protein V1227_37800 [Lentzea sp. DG1S-22]|uniref:beta family protein n=1 Tax=Lentzea sp. DG1S-22 TaxID=3108822 RepID=UPI002E77B7D7|nr:hypothetical protein [Lentzea sp. DG1S-22]WVH85102.1 hypothetical protein V1227_37800 [Lentzea sp. DG1S-22]
MSFTPLVALKSKMGEFDSLLHLDNHENSTPRVVIELLDSVRPAGRGVFRSLMDAAVELAGRGRPAWIDPHLLTPAGGLAQCAGGPFEHLDNCIENALQDKFGLLIPDVPALIPVVPASATDGELRTIALLQEHRPREVVVRFRDLGADRLADRLRHIASLTRLGDQAMHAVIDLGHVQNVDQRQVESAVVLARALTDHLGPASTTLLAGSIPDTRHGYATTVRDRPEVRLWRELVARVSEAQIHYGDYGVVHPRPSAAGGTGGRLPNPYFVYTVPGNVITLRRQLVRESGKVAEGAAGEAFSDIADELVARQEFAGTGYSWGDRELAACRRGGNRTAGSVPRWIAMATSHHIAHLTRRAPAEL